MTRVYFSMAIEASIAHVLRDKFEGHQFWIIFDCLFSSSSFFLTSTYVESYFTSWKFPTLAICLIIYNTLWSENWLFNAPLDVTLKIILSAFLPANFVTWMIMVLMVFSILFQDYEFNATNYRHKHSCAFSPCVQIWVFCCRSAPLAQRDDNFQNGGHEM